MSRRNSELELKGNMLYRAEYIDYNAEEIIEIWRGIREDHKLLEDAIEVIEHHLDKKSTFASNPIVELILIDHKNIPNDIYKKVLDNIYSNVDLARIVLNGYSNGGDSFLLLALSNFDYILTEEQKNFAINEAMNKVGTVRYNQIVCKMNEEALEKQLEKEVSNTKCVNNIDEQNYCFEMIYLLNTNQAHGRGEFDIRYAILRNPNFIDKMYDLTYAFYDEEDCYANAFEQFEWNIVNDYVKEGEPKIYIDEVLFIEDEDVLKRFDIEAEKVLGEIHFIKTLYSIRNPRYEEDEEYTKKMVL